MRKAAIVELTPAQRADLAERLEFQPLTGRQRRRVQILLLADQGQTDEQIVAATGAGRATVERVRKRFAAEGCEAALVEKPRAGAPALSGPSRGATAGERGARRPESPPLPGWRASQSAPRGRSPRRAPRARESR